ncbi:PAS domain S-box protein [Hydrogenophaga sp.]|uniref:PAS domain S-box protein n=1 Tax=Hydrogenophaga sp. TaxID=1904254 RepID=UPI003564C6CD
MSEESGSARASVQPPPNDPTHSALLQQHQRHALWSIILTLSLGVPLVTWFLYRREGFTALFFTAAGLTLLIWTVWLLYRLQRYRLAIHLLVFGILVAGILGTMAHGSVRSAAVLVMIAAVVGSTSFLPVRTMVLTALLCVAALAGLNIAENMGLLHQRPDLRAGWALWITQSVVMAGILVSVYVGRKRLADALHKQDLALTRQKQVERQLRASEGQFMALFHNNPAATLVVQAETQKLLEANDAYLRMFGITRAQLSTATPPMFWQDQEERKQFVAQMQEKGYVQAFEAIGKRRDGSTFEGLVSAAQVTQGPEPLLIVTVLDVSAQARAQRALRRSEDRFSRAFQASPLGMSITRLSDGCFIESNPAYEKVLGYNNAELRGKNWQQAGLWFSEDERNQFIGLLQRKGQTLGYSARLRTRKGDAITVKIWSVVIEVDGDACELSYAVDDSEDRRRETLLLNMAKGLSRETGLRFFQSLVQHMAHAFKADLVIVGEIDPMQNVQTVAAYHDAALVPNVRYPLAGTPCGHTVDTVGTSHFFGDLKRRFSPDQFPIGSSYESYIGVALRDADGSPIGLLTAMWKTPMDRTPELLAMMAIFSSRCNAELIRLRRDREIQKLRETLEHRVEERTAQLEYLNRELDTFAYTVSHDLKSPLRAIAGFMHVLRDQMAERIQAPDEELIQRVMASTTRMSSLINDLLALARVSQSELTRKPVDLSELAHDVLRHEQQREPQRQVDIHVEPGLIANCDPDLARIVLENLLGNAWKYSRHQTQPRIEIGQEATPLTGRMVFFVRDNGAGFDMARSDRLFKPFNRLHGAKEFEGSGIGLATVRRIIERHGGHIEGEGVPGLGATFRFCFGNEAGLDT